MRTSAIASGFICSDPAAPVPPVSMVVTPSCITLLAPPPPSRSRPETPGASAARFAYERVEMGRFATASLETVNDRSPVLD
jgi:hypothetical protein